AEVDKSDHECRYSVPSILDLLLKNNNSVRLNHDAADSSRINNVGHRCTVSFPSQVRRIEAFAPYAIGDVLKQPGFTVVEIEYRERLTVSAPSANSENAFFFKTDDVHFVFAQGIQSRHGLAQSDQFLMKLQHRSMEWPVLQRMIKFRVLKSTFVLRVRGLA